MSDNWQSFDDFARELEQVLVGRTTLERALFIAEGFREAFGGRWIIEANADGGFRVVRQ